MDNNLNCEECRNNLPDSLKEFLDKNCNVFYSETYYEVQLKKQYKPIYLYDEEYILLVVLCRELFVFKVAMLPVEYVSIQNQHIESAKEFLNKIVFYLKNIKKVHWIGPTSTSAFFMAYPDKSEWIPFGSHVVDLSQTEDTIWANIHSKHRNVIRKAEKAGLNIIFGNSEQLIEDFSYLDKITWKRSGMKGHNAEFLETWLNDMAIK